MEIAFRNTDRILVAKDAGRVIGFAAYGPYRDSGLREAGEVYAIYILREYYGKGVGYALMNAAVERLKGYSAIAVWVLEGNRRAIRFYQRYGFYFDGTKKEIILGTQNTELRMILIRRTG